MAKLMNWHNFSQAMKEKDILLFSALDVQRVFSASPSAATFLLYRYAKKGFIKRIKQGLYVFPDALPPDPYIANRLYEPSYVSLQFALSYHRIIPETVYEITSVTPKATRRLEALGKIFSYRRIARKAFTGYTIVQQQGFGFAIADAEKAFVDTLYYRLLSGSISLDRFDKEKITTKKALEYATLFQNKKLIDLVITLLQ